MIVWATMPSGKAIPLDPEPADAGNIVYVAPGRVRMHEPLFDRDEKRFVSHFATCPNADEYRRRSR